MIWNMRKLLLICLLAVSVCLTGCSFEAVPSRYDMKLKSDTNAIEIENGGGVETVEVTVDSRSFHDMSSETDRMFLSYHLLDHQGNILIHDGIRTSLDPIPARGIKEERVDIQIPLEAGNYMAEIDLVEEGVTWFSEQGMETVKIPITVRETAQPYYSKITITSDLQAIEIQPGENLEIPITIHNNSGIALFSSGEQGVVLSYRVYDNSGLLISEGARIALPTYINTGGEFTLILTPQTGAFPSSGTCQMNIGLLIEGTAWLSDWGAEELSIPVTIHPE